MTIRVKPKVNVRIYEGPDQKDALFAPDDTLAEQISDTYLRWHSGGINILDGVTEDLPLGDVDVPKGVYLEVDQNLKMKLNGGSEVLQLEVINGATGPLAKFFFQGTIGQVTLINDTGNVATGKFCFWGDINP